MGWSDTIVDLPNVPVEEKTVEGMDEETKAPLVAEARENKNRGEEMKRMGPWSETQWAVYLWT